MTAAEEHTVPHQHGLSPAIGSVLIYYCDLHGKGDDISRVSMGCCVESESSLLLSVVVDCTEIIVPSFYNEARLGFRYNAEIRSVKFRCRKSFIIPPPWSSSTACQS